tara:strand:+ start:428 stop:919 length:492 start_codon:yes stop_codon:yes gene_type:complete
MHFHPEAISFLGRVSSEKEIRLPKTLNPKDDGATGKFLEDRVIENVHGNCDADIPGILEYKTHNQDGTTNDIMLSKFTQPKNPQGKDMIDQLTDKFGYLFVLDEYVLINSIIIKKKLIVYDNLAKDWLKFVTYRPSKKPGGYFYWSVNKNRLEYMYENATVIY